MYWTGLLHIEINQTLQPSWRWCHVHAPGADHFAMVWFKKKTFSSGMKCSLKKRRKSAKAWTFWNQSVHLSSMEPEPCIDNDEIAYKCATIWYGFVTIFSSQSTITSCPTWIEGGLHGRMARWGTLRGRSKVPGFHSADLSLVVLFSLSRVWYQEYSVHFTKNIRGDRATEGHKKIW